MMRHPRDRRIRKHLGNGSHRLPNPRAVPIQPLPAQAGIQVPPEPHILPHPSRCIPKRGIEHHQIHRGVVWLQGGDGVSDYRVEEVV
jgi:hypothetical protein